jgi:hypothetical protein
MDPPPEQQVAMPPLRSLRIFGSAILCLAATSASAPGRSARQDDSAARERIRVLVRDSKDADDARRLKAWEALLGLGDPGAQALRPVLEAKLARDRETVEERLKGKELARLRKLYEAELLARRQAALACVFDPKRYPDENHGAAGQGEVDLLVAAVREAWDHPVQFARRFSPELDRACSGLEEVLAYGEPAGFAAPAELTNVSAWLDSLSPRFDREPLGIGGAQHDWNRAVLEWHATELPTSADESERACMDATNAYRLMMGKTILEIDERLVRAARKHSQEMVDLGYFAHESPVAENRSPGLRCAREGYSGGGAENIAIAGDGRGAFDAWYSSSGHHRNMLGGHRQFGIGRAGEFPGRTFTQNFGGGDSLRGRTIEDPQIAYLQKRRKLAMADPDAHYALAVWCKANGLPDLANLHAETAVALAPGHAKALEFLGRKRRT